METELKTPEKFKNKSQYSLWCRFWRHIKIWDGLWSIPLTMFIFVIVGFLGQLYFGPEFGFYDPTFIQAAFLTCALLVIANCVTWFIMYFNFRDLWKYYIRYSKDEFGNLEKWQKIRVLLFLYCFYMVAFIVLLKALI